MRKDITQKILKETAEETKIYVRKMADIAVRIHQLMERKNLTQKDLADCLSKQPSEISKWLSGEHNLTIKSLIKLEAELGADIFTVPQK